MAGSYTISEDTARAALSALVKEHQGWHGDGLSSCNCPVAKAWRELTRLLGER